MILLAIAATFKVRSIAAPPQLLMSNVPVPNDFTKHRITSSPITPETILIGKKMKL
ncbi:MAG: hypothetical protein UU12_C0017G0004 [Candidatus Woesebacteria bacterium GW2011_GWA2_40_7b]|uniref:Uncharacterized protein n=1 Tax=Candidatus Woesebacteria bacterium GW2011_GWA2_40_7b TaxID=1618563 RepID=A0A0G0T111_9BACT|nr:MAG: hypothetical protein UU12_C0017G0004 [Candidatus Woesebacteria bacterium GW2011_GWA2_40_7b]